jgi:predicted RecA/RadA family phage recombinase
MARRIQEGRTIDYTPSSDTQGGTVIIQNSLVGVLDVDLAAGELGAVSVEGVYEFAKLAGTGSAIAVGVKVYIIPSGDDALKATKEEDDGGDPAVDYIYAGKCVLAAADADTTVRVRLQQ